MKRCWDEQELAEHWTLFESEVALFANRTDRGKVGVAVLLKFFQFNARVPRHHKDVPGPVLAFVGEQLSIPPTAWFDYDLKGRSSKRDREQIRTFLGFRPITVGDEEQLRERLRRDVVSEDMDTRHLRSVVLDWCRDHRLEPPADDHTDRLIASAVHSFEEIFFADILRQLPEGIRERLDALVGSESTPEGADETTETTRSAFSLLKSDPGRTGLASVEREVAKLGLIRELDLPDRVWRQVSTKLLARYRTRAATESIRDLRRHAAPVRYTLLSAFCWQRRREITDGLVDLLIQIVHRISVRAEKRVIAEMVGELQRVEDKTGLLFRIADAALGNPDGIVREVLFPLVGESTLAALVKESQADGPTLRHRIQTLTHRSYGHHYRRMLPLVLATLRFRSNNSTHRPVIEALDWLRAHREDRRKRVPCSEVHIDGVVRPQLQEILVEDGPDGERINCPVSTILSGQRQLSCPVRCRCSLG